MDRLVHEAPRRDAEPSPNRGEAPVGSIVPYALHRDDESEAAARDVAAYRNAVAQWQALANVIAQHARSHNASQAMFEEIVAHARAVAAGAGAPAGDGGAGREPAVVVEGAAVDEVDL